MAVITNAVPASTAVITAFRFPGSALAMIPHLLPRHLRAVRRKSLRRRSVHTTEGSHHHSTGDDYSLNGSTCARFVEFSLDIRIGC